MASILKVDEMQGVSNTNEMTIAANNVTITGEGTATMRLQQGLCKAWADAENDASLNDSLNIASGTDNGTGDYVYAFTNAMNAALYASLMSASYANISQFDNGEQAASSYTVRGFSRADSLTASDHPNHSGIFGDLA